MADHTYNPDGIYLENWLNRNRAERYEAPQDLDLKHQQMAQVGLATDYMKQQLAENPEYDSNGNYTGEDGVWVRKADMLKAFDPNGELSKKLNAPIEQNLYEKVPGSRGDFLKISTNHSGAASKEPVCRCWKYRVFSASTPKWAASR